jgi:hypothetical protein
MTSKITLKELPDAVRAFADADFDADRMRTLMNLLQEQTPYIQKRFWKLSDATFVARLNDVRKARTDSFYPELQVTSVKVGA